MAQIISIRDKQAARPFNKVNYNIYLKEIDKYKILSKEEEQEIFAKIAKETDPIIKKRLQDKIINCNLRFVLSCAKQYQDKISGTTLTLEDVISEGNAGLIEAIDRFDYTTGNKFISYAVWWIRQYILVYIENNAKNIQPSTNRQKVYFKLRRLEAELEQKEQGPVSERQLYEEALKRDIFVETKNNDVGKYTSEMMYEQSITAKIGNDGDSGTLLDILEDKDSEKPTNELYNSDIINKVNNIIKTIPKETDKIIIEMWYGIGHAEPFTIHSIAERVNLTTERVRQKHIKIIRDLGKLHKNDKDLIA